VTNHALSEYDNIQCTVISIISIHGDKFKVIQFSGTHVSYYFLPTNIPIKYSLLLVHNLYLISVKLTDKRYRYYEHVISILVIVFQLANGNFGKKTWLQSHQSLAELELMAVVLT